MTACERTQPIVTGINALGELIWEIIEMPRWQMEMVRIPYHGDFAEHWMFKTWREKTDFEWESTGIWFFSHKKAAKELTGD